ncbi:MAG: hypothetical protein ACLQMO_12295 [Acidobacteriaceae bacterium]
MTSCAKCDGLAERRTFAAPEDYQNFVRLLIESMDQGKLVLMRADCPLDDMLQSPWPENDDVITHDLRCTGCGRVFQLGVNVRTGRNWWEAAHE